MAASRARRASTNTARIPSAKKSASPKPPMKKPLTDALHPRPKRPAPLFDRLELTSIHVTNMDRAVAFYRDTLGLRAAQIWPNWAEFPLKDGVLLGVQARRLRKDAFYGDMLVSQKDGMLENLLHGRDATFDGCPLALAPVILRPVGKNRHDILVHRAGKHQRTRCGQK